MRRTNRLLTAVTLVALSGMLAACENFDMDKFDILGLNEKKKLPGERKELFPQGVPGVTQGVPPEYVKGYQPPPDTPATAEGAEANTKTAAVETAEEPKPKPKRKPKPRVVAVPPTGPAPTQVTVQPGASQQQTAPWPTGSQAPQQASPAPWPNAPAPGTFSR
jgi:outer membrane biosynthesis protein TonB